ncbi:putative two-component system response regulator [Streptomyces ambofaciens ATCC 23877]|uniref:Putative two-component system response regulator n=1 Tax=Streptomyces ambofaciens (strain ATCC 23877 / 3486 / DSM 40053 / JCM 4204 / NBRC 12836 / NRRL B-2516) TaxID=278992 RepID=A0ABV1_STRA7|nr:putative two-component system response regulator [Streptomyces ambofaciens ATCC 23877]CAJ87954.1 putative two-component system response regulator [Streptomyces ambofaciens ATCC 23877]
MTRVLVVEDDPQLVRALVLNMRARHYGVEAAPDGATALRLAVAGRPDVVLLDLGLPDMDGVDVIKALRGWTRVLILVLSARQASGEGRRRRPGRSRPGPPPWRTTTPATPAGVTPCTARPHGSIRHSTR